MRIKASGSDNTGMLSSCALRILDMPGALLACTTKAVPLVGGVSRYPSPTAFANLPNPSLPISGVPVTTTSVLPSTLTLFRAT